MDSLAAKNKQAITKKSFEVSFDFKGTNYVAVENIGSGAYGVVCSAMNSVTKEKVAIKKIPNIFDQAVIAKRTYREIKILKHFKHDNIIAIREILKPPSGSDFPIDVYIVLDLMESDLHRIIHSKQELTIDHTKYFLYQILCGLNYIHSANVVHRDLKPSNLLVNANCDLKIGDFGMARGMGFMDSWDCKLTQYVATRWYRAPELISSTTAYTASVDMWSVGCIFAELLGRKVIFQGRNPIDQLNIIMDTLGSPSKELQRGYHKMHCRLIQAHGNKLRTPLRERISTAPDLAMDLLEKMLMYDPNQRLDVKQSLRHPLLQKYHDPDSVYEKQCIPLFDFSFENTELSKDELKTAIMKEVMDYHKPKRVSKIAFNFKPVSKSDLEKSQQMKAAAIRARNENKSEKPQSLSGLESMASSTKSQDPQTGKQDTVLNITSLTDYLNQKQGTNNVANIQDSNKKGNFNLGTKTISESNQVFKVPQGVPTKQSLQVSTANSSSTDVDMVSAGRSGTQKPSQSAQDVEMHSAKSEVKLDVGTDFKIDLSSHAEGDLIQMPKIEENSETGHEDKMNTKEILKAAILGAALRKQRGEIPPKPKPMTAMQRHKEKEEKRKKKLARAKEKKKKQREKEQSPLLTEEDRDLLQRWSKMQKPKAPEVVKNANKEDATSLSQGNLTTNVPANPLLGSAATLYKPIILSQIIPNNTLTSVQQPFLNQQSFVVSQTQPSFQTPFTNSIQIVDSTVMYQNTAGQVQVLGTSQQSAVVQSKQTLSNTGTSFTILNTQPQNVANQAPLAMGTTAFQTPATSITQDLSTQSIVVEANNENTFIESNIVTNQQPPILLSNTDTDAQASKNISQIPSTSNAFSPSDFLPFQTYDHQSGVDISNQLPTPDFAQFDSASPRKPKNVTESEERTESSENIDPKSTSCDENSRDSERNDSGADNTGLLSIITQLKRSHMNDPLSLAVTPRTTGEPYGVGPELLPDVFVPEDKQSAQMSGALSATESMIGDWLDLIGMDGVTVNDYETLKNELLALEEPTTEQQSR